MPRPRPAVLRLLLAALTLGSGVYNLLSVMGGPAPHHRLSRLLPLEFIHLARTLVLLIGFALVLSSLNIYRRKRRAWVVVVALTSFATVFHVTRGAEYAQAGFSAALLMALLAARRHFIVKSSPPQLASGVARLAISVAVAVVYGIAGFWLLDVRHFSMNFHLVDAARTTLRLLTLTPDPRLVPQTHYAQWFLDSIYVMGVTAAVYAGFALFRPVVYQFRELPRERAAAEALVAQFGRTSLDYFKHWQDKSYWFAPSHRGFVAYRVARDVALALGDPVGAPEEIERIAGGFVHFCRENGWIAAFHQTVPDYLPIYRRLGLKKLKIGDEAVVELERFSLEGKAKKEFRYKLRQLEAQGISTVEYQPPVPEEVIAAAEEVSRDWLRIPGRRERTFTLGQFRRDYVSSTPLLCAVDSSGEMLAFVNLITVPPQGEISIDLMRRRTDAPNGVMDYLFIKLCLLGKERGFSRLTLGMAPMAGFQEREKASAEERAIHAFFQQLNFLFSFRGLHAYKAKFATAWQPRYLIYGHVLDLPRVALALRRVSEITGPDNEEDA